MLTPCPCQPHATPFVGVFRRDPWAAGIGVVSKEIKDQRNWGQAENRKAKSPLQPLGQPPAFFQGNHAMRACLVTEYLVALLPQHGVGQQVNGTRLSTIGDGPRGGAAVLCIRMPHTAYLMRRC
jgi:hypothetical protein